MKNCEEYSNRRTLLRNVLAIGGLFFSWSTALGATKAKPVPEDAFQGEWRGEDGRLCAVFKEGGVLLVVNPLGSIGVAHQKGSQEVVVVGGIGWDVGLVGRLQADGKRIQWSNDTAWLKG